MAKEKKRGGAVKKMGGALLLGMAAGALVGWLTAPKKGSETKKDLEKRFKDLKNMLGSSREDLEAKLKRIFGVVTQETIEAYGRIRGEIMATMGKKKLEAGKYEATVDRLVAKYKSKYKLAKKTAEKLKDDLMKELKKRAKR